MKLDKVLCDVCKAYVAGKPIVIGDYNDSTVFVSADGFCGYFIPKSKFPLDRQVILGDRGPFNIGRVIPSPDRLTNATMTDRQRLVDKKVLQCLTDGKRDVWVNANFLKAFSPYATFQISEGMSPVLVYEDTVLTGLILPINPKAVN
jgi:hypothetical protein